MIISPNADMYYPISKYNMDINKLMKSIDDGLKRCDETNYNTKCVKYDKLNNFNILKYFINYLRSKGVNIIIYFSPFEPIFFNHIVRYNNFSTYNELIVNFCAENKLKVIGSYNPYDYKLRSEQFLDGIHPKESAIKIIFKNSLIKNIKY